MGYTKHEEFLKGLKIENPATDHFLPEQEEKTDDAETVEMRNKLQLYMELIEALGLNLDEEFYLCDSEDDDYECDYEMEEETEFTVNDLTFRKRTI